MSVCLSVYLSVMPVYRITKTADQIFMKFYDIVGHYPGTSRF